MAEGMSRALTAYSRRMRKEMDRLDAETRKPGQSDELPPSPTWQDQVAKAGGKTVRI
jgi:hypothetical protein